MLLIDKNIRLLCWKPEMQEDYGMYINNSLIKGWSIRQPNAMIEPFSEAVSGNGIVSYGLTSAGYDLRLGTNFKIFKNTKCTVIDPCRFGKGDGYEEDLFDCVTISFEEGVRSTIMVPPSPGYILAESMEYLRIPASIKAICTGKSTYARCGLIVNTTPAEPEWEGKLTIEIANTSPLPVRLYIGEGIAQMEFHLLTGRPETTYADKKGIYQGQTGVTSARTRG